MTIWCDYPMVFNFIKRSIMGDDDDKNNKFRNENELDTNGDGLRLILRGKNKVELYNRLVTNYLYQFIDGWGTPIPIDLMNGSQHQSIMSNQLVSIIWNLLIIGFSWNTFYESTTSTTSENVNQPIETKANNQSDLNGTQFLGRDSFSPLINYLRFCSLLVYFIFSYVLNIHLSIISCPLLKLCQQNIFPLITRHVEYVVSVRIVIIQSILVFILSCLFQLLLYLHFNEMLYERWAENVFNLYSLSAPLAIIAYVNGCLSNTINESGRRGQLLSHIRLLARLATIMNRFNELISVSIIIVILNSTVVTTISWTLLVIEPESSFHISVIGAAVYTSVIIGLVLLATNTNETSRRVTFDVFHKQLVQAACNDQFIGQNIVNQSSSVVSSHLLLIEKLEQSLLLRPYVLRNFSRKSRFRDELSI
ncbi:hypothetical protein BLOT_007834 [Blomia tropicalis]|nr:hypothetical protein BLOT_007834 [Blomia tropicalis]